MKKLYIVRHAKSSWKDHVSDMDRGLKKRGKLNAPLIASKLISRGAKVDAIIYSPAKRTTQTSRLINNILQVPVSNVHMHEGLYLAPPKQLINIIKSTPKNVNELMVIAHNPGVTQLVNFLAKEHFENIPTCGTACVLFDIEDWEEISNIGKLGFFIYPKMFKHL